MKHLEQHPQRDRLMGDHEGGIKSARWTCNRPHKGWPLHCRRLVAEDYTSVYTSGRIKDTYIYEDTQCWFSTHFQVSVGDAVVLDNIVLIPLVTPRESGLGAPISAMSQKERIVCFSATPPQNIFHCSRFPVSLPLFQTTYTTSHGRDCPRIRCRRTGNRCVKNPLHGGDAMMLTAVD